MARAYLFALPANVRLAWEGQTPWLIFPFITDKEKNVFQLLLQEGAGSLHPTARSSSKLLSCINSG